MMTAKEAIHYIVEYFGLKSYYAIAKALSDEDLKVQPIQISNYYKGGRMSAKVAKRVFDTFGIVISDTFDKSKYGKFNVDSERSSDCSCE